MLSDKIGSVKYDLIHRYNSMSQIERDEIDRIAYDTIMDILMHHKDQTTGCNSRLIEGLKKALDEI